MESVQGRLVGLTTLSALLAGLLVAAMAMPAQASCAAEAEDAIAEQETVFLGTAVEQTDRYARVEVEAVWRGTDLAPTVWLQTSAADPPPWPASLVLRAATSVDAELVPGARYVIAAVDDGFQTNDCLVTDASASVLERLAPQDTRQPTAAGATGAGPGLLEGTSGIALAIALLVALPVSGWLAARRFRAARRAGRGNTVTGAGS